MCYKAIAIRKARQSRGALVRMNANPLPSSLNDQPLLSDPEPPEYQEAVPYGPDSSAPPLYKEYSYFDSNNIAL